MNPTFYMQYKPLTSRPFLCNSTYTEYTPCQQLVPYIACYWESFHYSGSAEEQEVLVIPDTCADMIIEINHTKHTMESCFCGLSDSPVRIKPKPVGETVMTFAVRFHFWAVRLFFNVGMKELYNQVIHFEQIDSKTFRDFELFFNLASTVDRINWMENLLLKKLQDLSVRNGFNSNVYNTIDQILAASGNISIREACEYTCVSQRQMERLFLQDIGISIKRTADLVRYQNVWKDIVRQDIFQIQDAVNHYGFADQSHLLNEFRRFHGMTPQQAKQSALINQ